MSKFQSAVCLRAALILLSSGVAPSVFGLANRVFVSARSGNDANACDNINTPCQTFAGAVLQLNPGGDAIVLDSGGYGKVTITQSLTIEASPGVTAFIHPSSGNAITINAGAGDTVILRGLVLNVGPALGILVATVGELHVENCVIEGFTGGIQFTASGKLYVADTVVRNSFFGMDLHPNSGTGIAAIERCRLENNGNGLLVVAGNTTAKASVKDSFATGQVIIGLRAEAGTGGTVEVNIENCLFANNDTGISSATDTGTAVVRVSNTTVTDNSSIGIEASLSGQILTRGNNTVEGNGTNGSFTGSFAAK